MAPAIESMGTGTTVKGIKLTQLHALDFVRSTQYCDYNGEECYDFSELGNIPDLYNVLSIGGADASDYTGTTNFGGQVQAGSFSVVGSGNIFYYLDNGQGLISQIQQQTGTGDLFISAGGDSITMQDTLYAPTIFEGE